MAKNRNERELIGMIQNSKHDQLVACLEERLKKKGYDYLESHREYRRSLPGDCSPHRYDLFCGEMNVFAIRGHYAHYYECKSNHTPQGYQRALQQFLRVYAVFPEYKWKFIYVTNDRVVKLHPID